MQKKLCTGLPVVYYSYHEWVPSNGITVLEMVGGSHLWRSDHPTALGIFVWNDAQRTNYNDIGSLHNSHHCNITSNGQPTNLVGCPQRYFTNSPGARTQMAGIYYISHFITPAEVDSNVGSHDKTVGNRSQGVGQSWKLYTATGNNPATPGIFTVDDFDVTTAVADNVGSL